MCHNRNILILDLQGDDLIVLKETDGLTLEFLREIMSCTVQCEWMWSVSEAQFHMVVHSINHDT